MQLKRTVLVYLWLHITSINCLPGMLKSNREIASKLQCEISQQVDELLQIEKLSNDEYGILRTKNGYSLIFQHLENSYIEDQVIVTVNKRRQVEFNNYLQYQHKYEFEQFIIEGLNYIYTKTKFTGIIVHILSIYQQGQVKQQIYETQNGLQYNFKLNEQQDYFIQIIFATSINNDFQGNQQEIENIIKTLNLEYQKCRPNTCKNDQEFRELLSGIDLHQQNPKLISSAQYRTRQSIYNYELINNIYISSIQSNEIVRYLNFTDECIQIMSKQDEINNIQIEFEQYFCVANIIQSFKFTQFSQKQLNYFIVLQQSPDSDTDLLIDRLLQLVSSLKCMKDKSHKLIQSSSLFLQQQQSQSQAIPPNLVEFQDNNVEVESISFDVQQPISEQKDQISESNISDDIFDQPKQIEEQQHQERLNQVEQQLAKTQEIAESISFDPIVNDEIKPDASTTTTEQIVFDEYNSQNQDISSPQTNDQIVEEPQVEILESQQPEQIINDPKIENQNVNDSKNENQDVQQIEDNQGYHHHHHHHHHHHQNLIHHHNHGHSGSEEQFEYDENNYNDKIKTNLRGRRNQEEDEPIIADKIVIEYNFVHQQPLKKGNVNCDKNKKQKETDSEENQNQEVEQQRQVSDEQDKPKKNCKPKNKIQENENEAIDKEEVQNEENNDKQAKCEKKRNKSNQEEVEQEQADEQQDVKLDTNNKENEEEQQETNEEQIETEEQPKKKKNCKKNKNQEQQEEPDNVEVDQVKEYDIVEPEEKTCKRNRHSQDEYMREEYNNEIPEGIEDELYWRYKHMKKQQRSYPFNGYPYRHRKQSVDHSPFPHASPYYKKHPFSIPTTNQAPWVGRDFFPDSGYGMGRVMDAYKGRYSDPEQVLRDLAIQNKQQKQWKESFQHYRDQVGYGDEYQYYDQPPYQDYENPNEFQPFAEPQEQVYDYLNDSQYQFRQGKKPLQKPNRNQEQYVDQQRGYQESDCFVIYDQCHYQGRRLKLCGEYPDIPSNIQGFKIFSFIIPDNLELRFFQSSDYENNVKDVEGSQECLEIPYELIPQQ